MMGSEIRPIEMTDAATTPVVAASIAPTMITANASPPRTGPNSWPMVSSRSSAMPERSRIRPMKVKNGIASSVSFCMIPKMRSGKACINEAGSMPISTPMNPNSRPQAASENDTENPTSKNAIRPTNISGAMSACKKAIMPRLLARLGRLLGPAPALESPRPVLPQPF